MENNFENNTVLFVDDEENILKSLKRALFNEPYRKLFANSGEEALKILSKEEIHVIVTDMRMPGMNGLQLLRKIQPDYPDMVKLVLSGFAEISQVIATVNQVDIFKYITKPWEMDDLKTILRAALNYYNVKFDNDLLKASLEQKNLMYLKLLKTNNTKYMSIKRDFTCLARFHERMTEHILILGKKLSEEKIEIEKYNELINLTAEFHKKYSSYFPLDFLEFDIDWFIQDINRLIFKQLFPDNSREYNRDIRYVDVMGIEKINSSYYGNFKILLFVFKKIVENIFNWKLMRSCTLFIESIESESTEFETLRFSMTDSTSMYNQDTEVLEIYCELIRSALLGINGDLQIVKRDNKQQIYIEFEFMLEEYDGKRGVENYEGS